MTILEKADGVDWLMELDSGNTMYAFAGSGHSDADLLETVRSIEGDDIDGESPALGFIPKDRLSGRSIAELLP